MTIFNRGNKLESELEQNPSRVLTFTKLREKFDRQKPDHPWERDVEKVERELFEIDRYKRFVNFMLKEYSFKIYDLSHGPFIHGRRVGILANVFRKKQKMTHLEPYKELIAVGGWMHDLGKLGLRNLTDDWDLHEQKSVEIAKKTLPDLRYEPNEINDISFMISHHIFSVKHTYKELLKKMLKETDDMDLIESTFLLMDADRSDKLWREVAGIPSSSVYFTLMLGRHSTDSYTISSNLLRSNMDIHFDRVKKGENVIPPYFSFVKRSYRRFTKGLPHAIKKFKKILSEYDTFMITNEDRSYIRDLNKEIGRQRLGRIPYLVKVLSERLY